MIAAAKSASGFLNFGSGGIGNSQHLAGELFNQMAGICTLHVRIQARDRVWWPS